MLGFVDFLNEMLEAEPGNKSPCYTAVPIVTGDRTNDHVVTSGSDMCLDSPQGKGSNSLQTYAMKTFPSFMYERMKWGYQGSFVVVSFNRMSRKIRFYLSVCVCVRACMCVFLWTDVKKLT